MARRNLSQLFIFGCAVAFLISGCASDNAKVEVGDDPGVTVCSPADAETARVVFSVNILEVTGDHDAIVTDVRLAKSEGAELIGYDFGFLDDPDWAANSLPYDQYGPPEEPADPVLKAGRRYTMKIGLKVDDKGASVSSLDVTYRSDDSSSLHTVQTRVQINVPPPGRWCF